MTGDLASAFDRIVARSSDGALEAEVARAREEYFERTGRVFEEDEIYEARTVAFLEWYALDRAGEDGRTPAERCLLELDAAVAAGGSEGASVAAGAGETNPVREATRALCTTHRSLFEVIEIGEGEVLLADLAAGGRHRVTERRKLPGVAPADLFEARLAAHRGEILFLRTFLFHPRAAADAIRQLALEHRRARAEPSLLCEQLATLRVRCERYRHVAVARIYDGTAHSGAVVVGRGR